MVDTLTSPYNKTFPFMTLMYLSTLWFWQSISIVVSSKRLQLCPFPTKPQYQDLSSKTYCPNPDIMIIVIVFLHYWYTGDSFIAIPRYNDVILPVPWYIGIWGFHFNYVKFHLTVLNTTFFNRNLTRRYTVLLFFSACLLQMIVCSATLHSFEVKKLAVSNRLYIELCFCCLILYF